MWTWIQQELGTGFEARALALLADVGLKGIVLMALASLAAFAMKRSTASARHLVYLLALGGLLFLPFVSLLVPMWQLPILPASESPAVPAPRSLNAIPDTPTTGPAPAPKTAPMNVPTTPLPVEADKRAPVIATPTPAVPYVEESTPVDTSTPTRVAGWLLAAWLVMVFILLFPLLAGLGALRRMTRHATPFTGDALPLLTQELAHALELRRPVRLLRAPAGTMPMAAGLFRGVVFLPAEAESWSDEKRRAVLLHELAHVKRRDCLTHALALLAVALHWFNPFAWLALRQLRVEREHACDDLVLTAGERPAEYAEVLLDVARSFRAGTLASAAAITMAKKSHLEGRLLAVLDEARKRTRLTRRAVLGFALVGALLTAALSTLHVTRAESKAVVDHLTFSSGVEVSLVGVGIPSRDDATPPWKPDGTPLDELPDGASEIHMPDLTTNGRVYRQVFQRFTAPETLAETVTMRTGRTGSFITQKLPPGYNAADSVTRTLDRDAETFEIEVGVAAGPWEPLAQTIPESGAQGTRQGVTCHILVGKPFKRDDKYHFTLTHDVIVELDMRVVVYDSLGKMHYTPVTGTSPGSGSTRMGEYSLGDFPPEEVRAVELQVREFEWRKFRNIPVNPEATIPPSDDVEEAPATQDLSTPEESRYTATFSPDLQARIAGVGQPDEYTVSSVWAPDGAPMAGIPEGFATKMGGSSSDKSGIKRRFFIEVSPVPEESDLGIKFKVEGNSVAHNVRKSRDKAFISAEIYNLPDTRDDTSFELGIAFGPWESLYGTMGPHSSSEGSESGAAFSDFFEKEGKPHVVVTHTPRDDDFRLIVFDGDNTTYASRQVSSFGVGGMHQTEFVVEGDIRSSELIYMDFQARPFEWRTLSNIAIHPDDSDATGSADDPSAAAPPAETVEENASFPPPTVTLSAHAFQQVRAPVILRLDSSMKELNSFTSKITIRCDGEELPWFSTEESGVKMMIGANFSVSPRHPLEGLAAGKHRVSVVLHNVEVQRPSGFDVRNPSIFTDLPHGDFDGAIYEAIETNTVEFEVVPEIPADYFEPTMEDGWKSILDKAFADIRVQDHDDKPVVLYLDWRNVESIERPFALAFDVAMEEQTSGTTHPIGRMTAEAGKTFSPPRQHIPITMDNDDARNLFRTWYGEQVRLVMTPSPEAALEDPAIRRYYDEVYTSDWIVLKPELSWNVDRTLAPYGVEEVVRYGNKGAPFGADGAPRHGNADEAIAIEDWGVTCKAILDGGAVVRDPESDTRFMPLKDIVLPGAALDYIEQHLQELDESEVREIAIAPGALNYIGVRAPSGEVWILLVDTNRFGEREVYRWQVPPSPSAQLRPGWLRLEFRAHELLARSGDYRTVLVRNNTRLLRVESDLTGVDQPEGDELLQIAISGGPGRPARYGHVTTPNLGTRRELERTNGLTPGSDQITKEYILRRSWDGAHVGVPALVTPNRMMRVSDVWRTWRSANDSRTIEYIDDYGWRFVAHGAGWSPRRPDEIRYPLLSLFESYRPNGTLYSRTELTEGRPDTTHFYALNGITLDGQTRLTWNETDGTASLADFTWRVENDHYRRYIGSPNGVIHEEEVLALVDGEFIVQERLQHASDSEAHAFELDMDAIVGPLANFRQETRESSLAASTNAELAAGTDTQE